MEVEGREKWEGEELVGRGEGEKRRETEEGERSCCVCGVKVDLKLTFPSSLGDWRSMDYRKVDHDLRTFLQSQNFQRFH